MKIKRIIPLLALGGALLFAVNSLADTRCNDVSTAGTTTATGNGTASAGCKRVTIASNNTPFPVKTDQTTHGTTDLVATERATVTDVPIGATAVTCVLTTTATSSTQVTGCEVQSGKSFYITDIEVAGDAANATATPVIIQSGTSTACTGPHILWSGYHPAVSTITQGFRTPLQVTVSEGLCILDGTTGTKKVTLSGYYK